MEHSTNIGMNRFRAYNQEVCSKVFQKSGHGDLINGIYTSIFKF